MSFSEGVTRKMKGPKPVSMGAPVMRTSHLPQSKIRPAPADHGGKKRLGTFHDGSGKSKPKASKGC